MLFNFGTTTKKILLYEGFFIELNCSVKERIKS